MKKDIWLVVANSSIAHIYKVENRHSLKEIKFLEHPESRLHNLDLVSDKPGRTYDSVGGGRHAVGGCVTPKKHECQVFANEIVNSLESARNNNEYEELYIVACPSVLGLIRQGLSSSTTKLIQGESDKDMTQMKSNEILSNLPFFSNFG